MRVYVKNLRNESLMPCSQRKARILVKQGKAKIIDYKPFTIQLLCATGETTQQCNLGVDSGAKHIGVAITTRNKVLTKGTIELRNDIKELLTSRRESRRSRRQRKTRYRRCKFKYKTNREYDKKKGNFVKHKINFISSRKEDWLPPSIQSRVDNQIFWINKFQSLLPNCNLTIEVGKFDVAKLINPNIQGIEYQQGDLYEYENVKAYLIARENGKCQFCGKEYDGNGWHIHHINQRKDAGSDRTQNLALTHEQCHIDFHKGKLKVKLKKPKEYKETAFMNILRQQIFKRLNCNITYGNYTKVNREKLELEKSHYNDAIVISGIQEIKENCKDIFIIKQFRKKKRSLHEAIPRKGRKEPNREAKRNSKNTKHSNGFYLNDKVKVLGKIGWISGFCNGGCYVKDIEDNYITMPNKTYKQVGFKNIELMCHNNNWQFIPSL